MCKDGFSIKDRYDAIAYQIDREDHLAFSRVRILLATIAGQVALAAALASGSQQVVDSWLGLLILLISGVGGFLLSCTTLKGVNAAFEQIDYLRDQFKKLKGKYPELCFPRPHGEGRAHDHGKGTLSAVSMLGFVVSGTLIVAAIFGSYVAMMQACKQLRPAGQPAAYFHLNGVALCHAPPSK